MTPEQWKRLEVLFETAASMSPLQRRRFLDRACRGDEELQREVEAMLRWDERAERFLETPLAGLVEGQPSPETASPAPLLAPGEEIGPYRIVALRGVGGMAEVYSALDTRLDRMVAIKVLSPPLTARSEALVRFHREALAVSALSHPHISTLHDIGDYKGRPFLVMELIEGQTLKQRLAGGALPEPELLSVGMQAASALAAVHAKGIVHRDIKPANIFLTSDGVVKIVDFGIAKLFAGRADAGSTEAEMPSAGSLEVTLTEPGKLMGTAPYMAPEQILGKEVDARSDLFSLGVTLYECATGALPFRGSTRSEVTEAILRESPAPPRQINSRISPELNRTLLKALEKDPARRHQSAKELQADLEHCRRVRETAVRRRWITGILAASLVFAAAFAGLTLWRTKEAQPPIRRVAVLPLKNLTGDDAHEHLASGISNTIAEDLAKMRGLRVIAPASAAIAGKSGKKASDVIRELNVDAVIQGSMGSTGQRIQFRLAMTRAGSEEPAWAESFDFDLAVFGTIQRQVERTLARELRLRLSPTERASTLHAGTARREAFEAYLRGRHLWAKRTEADIQRAVDYFRAAIDADPAYAHAYAALADCYNQLATVLVGQSPAYYRALAIAAAKRAIEINDQLAEGHAALGFAKLYDWDWAGAELELRRALDLNPSYASAHVWYASSLIIRRRFDDAIAEVRRAAELDPLSLITQTQVGWMYKLADRDEDAIPWFRNVLAVDPDYPWALVQLGGSCMNTGRFQEGIEVMERAVRASKGNPAMIGSLGQAYGMAGRREEAKRILERLERLSAERYVTPIAFVYVCLGLRDRECAFKYLEKAFEERSNYIAYLPVEPKERLYPEVRSDPRFQDMLRRLGH